MKSIVDVDSPTKNIALPPEPISFSADAVPEEEISLLDLLIIVARSKWLIGKVALAVTVLGVLLSLVWPTRYTATTSLLPPQSAPPSSALFSQLGGMGSVASLAGVGLGLKNPNDVQVALLKSRVVEDAVIDRFHLVSRYKLKRLSDARKKLERVVAIDTGAKDGLIRLSVTDRDAGFAAALANGYVEEFKRFSATLAVTEAAQRRVFFERQLLEAKDNLANAEEDLKRSEQKTGLVQLDSQSRAIVESVAQLRAQIAAKEIEIRSMRSFAADENPDLLRAEQELAGLRAQESKMGAASSDSSDSLLIPKGVLQQVGLEYVRKVRDVKYFETIFDMLARQYEAAKVDEARQGALIQVVDPAIAPDRRSAPRRTLIVLGSCALGVVVGLVWAFVRAGLARLRENPSERVRLQLLGQALHGR